MLRKIDLACHVGAGINASLWEFRKGNLETLLDRLQHLLISLAADERDGKTLSSETTGTTDTMEV